MRNLEFYIPLVMTFLVNALVVSSIGAISVETRLGIEHSPLAPPSNSNPFQAFGQNFFYILKILPYKFANITGSLSKKGTIPEWIKGIYTFIITFIIALFVYHILLLLLGPKKLYKYFFGNLPSLTKLNLKQTK